MKDPLTFVMPFGRYKKKTLKEVMSSKVGIEYVRWAANNEHFNNTEVKGACKEALKAAKL